jgi:hypothetical protein
MSAAISDDFYSDGKRHYGTLENQSDSIKKPLIDKPKGNSNKYFKLLLPIKKLHYLRQERALFRPW